MAPTTIADESECCLRTGDAGPIGNPWPGDIIERGRRHPDLRGELVKEVLVRRSE